MYKSSSRLANKIVSSAYLKLFMILTPIIAPILDESKSKILNIT